MPMVASDKHGETLFIESLREGCWLAIEGNSHEWISAN